MILIDLHFRGEKTIEMTCKTWAWLTISNSWTQLTVHHWQKWKRVSLTCPCHNIFRDEAVGLKVAKILEKLQFLWKCEIWVFKIA